MRYTAFLLLASCGLITAQNETSTKPNFVFIMADDLDMHLDSLDYQPAVQKHFAEQGTFFKKHFCTMAQCCPSRVSLWTGKAGHNTNVTDVSPPFGGYPKFISQGFNDDWLPIWLQKAGYNTFYTGKLMNAHSIYNYNNPYPAGWNGSDFLLDPNTYQYLNATMQRNREAPRSYLGNYSTDIIASKAIGFLEEAVAAKGPFFLGVMPIGPHAQTNFPESSGGTVKGSIATFDAPVPAKRHENLFPGVKVPRTANFNPDRASGASYVKKLARQNATVVDYNDYFYRRRLQALQAVDELVDDVVTRLESLGLANNTYIIYTSDNGYHIGQHHLDPGKSCGYEEDVNIPLFIRGPGIPKGVTATYPTSHTDLVPTMFELAGLALHDDFDGAPIPVKSFSKSSPKSEHINIEFWGEQLSEGDYRVHVTQPNNTYKGLRVVGEEYDLSYLVWCTNEHELYNIKTDQGQMSNLYNLNTTLLNTSTTKVVSRLDALMLVLKSCKGRTCTRPWETLHPKGNVHTLAQAMNPIYDGFYMEKQKKVGFEECALGYFPSLEGPQVALAYNGSDYGYLMGSHWSDWA